MKNLRKFKRFQMMLMSVTVFMAVTSLSGCESAEEKQLRLDRNHQIKMAKIANGQDVLEQEMLHERKLAYIQRPVAPGNYTDYRGNLNHGYWDNYGNWVWNDPRSGYATQSRNFVDYQMAMGVVGAAVITKALFDSNNSGGWKKTNVTVNNYTSIKGKKINKYKYRENRDIIDKKAEKLKKYKTVSKSTGTKKVDSKWKSKRTGEPAYGKRGFKSKFEANKKKVIHTKNNRKPVKSTYNKPAYKKTTYNKPVKQQKRTKQQKKSTK